MKDKKIKVINARIELDNSVWLQLNKYYSLKELRALLKEVSISYLDKILFNKEASIRAANIKQLEDIKKKRIKNQEYKAQSKEMNKIVLDDYDKQIAAFKASKMKKIQSLLKITKGDKK